MAVVLSLIFLHSINSTLGLNISDLRAISECLKCPYHALLKNFPTVSLKCLNSGTSITTLGPFWGALHREPIYCVVCLLAGNVGFPPISKCGAGPPLELATVNVFQENVC